MIAPRKGIRRRWQHFARGLNFHVFDVIQYSFKTVYRATPFIQVSLRMKNVCFYELHGYSFGNGYNFIFPAIFRPLQLKLIFDYNHRLD